MISSTRRRFLLRTLGLSCGLPLALPARGIQSPPASPSVSANVKRAVNEGLEFLALRQLPDGSIGSRFARGSVAVTSLAGLAFLAGGHHLSRGRHGRVVRRMLDYVLAQEASTPTGFLFAPTESEQPRMYSHGFGTLFLAEVYGMIPDAPLQRRARTALERAVQATISSQNREGGWRYDIKPPPMADVSVTICQIMALRAARNAGLYVPKDTVERCVRFVRECRTPDGGFSYFKGQGPSAFARTAAGVVALYSAGIYDPDEEPLIRRGLDYLNRFRPGTLNADQMLPDHYYYGQYYAALAMWTAGGQYWADWFPALTSELLRRRSSRADGAWDDFRWGPEFATAMACIVLQLPNNYLPIMQK